MPANIATTSFSSTPDNKAVTVDVYGSPPLTPTNNTPGKAPTSVLGQVANVNQFGADLLKQMAKNYATTGKVFNNQDKILQNVSDAMNVQKGILRSAGGNFLNSVLKGSGFYKTGIGKVVDGIAKSTTGNSLEKMVAGGFKDFSVTVNGVNKVIKNIKDVDSLTDLSKFLNGVAPDNPFLKAVNLTEIAGVIKGVAEVADAFNIPGALDRLISNLSDDDKKVVTGLVLSGTTVIKDLTTIDTMLEHLTGSEILSSNPDIIKILVAGFRSSSEYPEPSVTAANALKARLDKITPHWHQYHLSNDTWHDDLEVFVEFSPFTKNCFLAADMYTASIAIAGEYKARNFVTLANSFYPYIGLPETRA